MTDRSDSTNVLPETTHRRTLLKAGAHAVWVVPAVQLIGTAPAMAASGCTQSLSVTATWNAGRLSLTITNTGNQAVSNLTVTVGFNIGNPKYVSHAPTSWTKSEGHKMFTFTNGTLGPHATTTLQVRFRNYAQGKPGEASGEAGGTVSGGNACPAPYSVKTRNEPGADY